MIRNRLDYCAICGDGLSVNFEKGKPIDYCITHGTMTNHGGKRKGAGRKPRATPKEALTIRVEPEIAERFRAICEAKGRSQSEQLSEWVKRSK